MATGIYKREKVSDFWIQIALTVGAGCVYHFAIVKSQVDHLRETVQELRSRADNDREIIVVLRTKLDNIERVLEKIDRKLEQEK